jgi:hypothetical protein
MRLQWRRYLLQNKHYTAYGCQVIVTGELGAEYDGIL